MGKGEACQKYSATWRNLGSVGENLGPNRAWQMKIFSHIATERNGHTIATVFGSKKEIPVEDSGELIEDLCQALA